MDVTIGSLFSGYGGLDMAVGGRVAWYSDIEPAACTVMAAHHPDVPNLGDITQIDWTQVTPVDVITGGYPCQPFSTAGQRRGTDDERHLWPYVRDAIGYLAPRLAVLENVAGHLSLGLGTVIGELSELGYSARWGVVRAADAGAPHSRKRVFIAAYADSEGSQGADAWLDVAAGWSDAGGHASAGDHGTTSDSAGHISDERSVGYNARDVREAWEVEGPARGIDSDFDWEQYDTAIRRWGGVLGRPAPVPTRHRDGRDRLNPQFVEWLMGLPEGHVTGHGLSATQELRMLGNGVCPQQARLALELLGVAA